MSRFQLSSPNRYAAARLASVVVFAVASALLSGCASLQSTPEETVQKLSNQRWQHLLARNYEKAYAMAVPSYRKLKSFDYYRDNMLAVPVRWKSAEFVRAQCGPQTCKVTVKVVSQLMLPTRFKGPLESAFDETWVFEDGQWWMYEAI